MSANRAKNSKPELLLRRALWHSGLRGYRLHHRIRLGPSTHHSSLITRHSSVRPDITFTRKKLAIFVHGCFWHRCPKCDYKLPKNNIEFWQAKFARNVARDEQKRIDLQNIGWKVITVWECDLKTDLDQIVETIRKALA